MRVTGLEFLPSDADVEAVAGERVKPPTGSTMVSVAAMEMLD